jgi:hypothetical protein
LLLEKCRDSGIVSVLPDEHTQHIEGEARELPEPNQDRSLEAISNEFRRVLRTDGTLDGDEDGLDHLRDQFRSIENEAARAGYLYEGLREDAVVFDMRPANVFTTDEGIVIPVDCIPVKLPPGKRDFFERF